MANKLKDTSLSDDQFESIRDDIRAIRTEHQQQSAFKEVFIKQDEFLALLSSVPVSDIEGLQGYLDAYYLFIACLKGAMVSDADALTVQLFRPA